MLPTTMQWIFMNSNYIESMISQILYISSSYCFPHKADSAVKRDHIDSTDPFIKGNRLGEMLYDYSQRPLQ